MRPVLGSAALRAAAFLVGLAILLVTGPERAARAEQVPVPPLPPPQIPSRQVPPAPTPSGTTTTDPLANGVPVEAIPTGFAPNGLADTPLTFDTNLGLIERTTTQAVEDALKGITIEPGADILLHPLTTSEGQWFVEDCIARVLSQKGYKIHLTGPDELAHANAGAAAATVPIDSTSSLGQMVQTQRAAGDTTVASAAPPVEGPGGQALPPPGPLRRKFLADLEAQKNPVLPPGTLIPLPDNAGLVLTFRIVEFGVTYHDSWRRGFMGPRLVERLASVDIYTRLVNGTAQNVLWAGRGRAERLDIVPQSKLDLLEGRTYPFTAPALRSRPLSRLAEPVLVSGIITGLVFLFYSSQH